MMALREATQRLWPLLLVVNLCVLVFVLVVKMKFISYNISGLGSFEKRKEIQKIVKLHRPWILCVQETKLEIINGFLCSSLWGNQHYGFSYRSSVGAFGGILTIWDSTGVDVIITRSLLMLLLFKAKW